MTEAQLRLRAVVRQLQNRPTRRVTNVALAQAIGNDESFIRRLLSDHSDLRIDFDRHLMPWMNLLGLTPDALVYLWADVHGLAVDVTMRAEGDQERGMAMAMAHAAAAAAEAQLATARAIEDGVVTTPELAEIEKTTEKAARAQRNVVPAAKRVAIGGRR